ncbi:AraC family transcriptional regulator [Pustulibacterium marinum]|uniref:AraC family transcriptional regulator n=2 Tax=Pustulibacterium marinum TaxID=1224947 RepID=A0A1I7F7S1_9FLAO|nr:AraC family transcriptional regulator [Pustulibacterium marinum]
MEVKIVYVKERVLIGKCMSMSFANNKSRELWQSFRSDLAKKSISVETPFVNLHNYPADFSFSAFNPNKEFDKWALVEVPESTEVPDCFEKFVLEAGYYATFEYQGLAQDCQVEVQKLFTEWLPKSGYQLDTRPHFEELGEGYHPLDPNSKEQIFVPVKK